MQGRTVTTMSLKKSLAVLLAITVVLPAVPAFAGEQIIDVPARRGHQTFRLPATTEEVQLVRPSSGSNCTFDYTWGYDLRRKELWVNGCSGRFRVVTTTGPGGYPPSGRPHPGGGSQWGGREVRGQNGLCLDISGGVRPGNELIVYQCNGGPNQRFERAGNGEIRVGGLCLDVAQGSRRQGAGVVAWECRNQPNQKWDWRGNEIRSRDTGMCLDLEGGRARPGQRVVMWPCTGASNQRWR